MRVPGWKPPVRIPPPPRPQSFGEQALKLAAVASGLTTLGSLRGPGPLFTYLGCLAWIELASACVVCGVLVLIPATRRKLATIKPTGVYRHWRGLSLLLLLLAPFTSYGPRVFASDTCPHAHYWSFGPIGVARSSVGGPCGNHGGGVHLWGEWWLTGPEAISPWVRNG
jgi:hypothetical protein